MGVAVEVTSNTQLIGGGGAQQPTEQSHAQDDYADLLSELLCERKSKKGKLVHRVADCSLSDCESSADSIKSAAATVELPDRLATFEELVVESEDHAMEWELPQPARMSKKAMKKQRQAQKAKEDPPPAETKPVEPETPLLILRPQLQKQKPAAKTSAPAKEKKVTAAPTPAKNEAKPEEPGMKTPPKASPIQSQSSSAHSSVQRESNQKPTSAAAPQ